MKMKNINLQDVFLNQVRKAKLLVTVYLTNGFQFKGIVRGFDNFTVIPAKAISILENIPEGDGAEEESEGEEWARV